MKENLLVGIVLWELSKYIKCVWKIGSESKRLFDLWEKEMLKLTI